MCLIIVQFGMGNVVEPRLVGSKMNLSPVVILFALLSWGWLWGVLGMFLAVPITVVMKIVFENIEDLKFVSVLMSSSGTKD